MSDFEWTSAGNHMQMQPSDIQLKCIIFDRKAKIALQFKNSKIQNQFDFTFLKIEKICENIFSAPDQ